MRIKQLKNHPFIKMVDIKRDGFGLFSFYIPKYLPAGNRALCKLLPVLRNGLLLPCRFSKRKH